MSHKPFSLLAINGLLPDEELEDTGVASRDMLELKTLIVRLFRAPDYRAPTFPSVARELYLASKEESVPLDRVVALVGRDRELVSRVVGDARLSADPKSLTDSVATLGVRRTAELALRSGFESSVFRSRSYAAAMDRLRLHSVFTAELLGVVSENTGQPGQDAYLCGLLHDVGIAGILLALENAGLSVPIERAWPTVWAIHESCSQYLASAWGFSEDVANRIALHHNLVLDGDDDRGTLALALVDGLAHEVECGIHDRFSRRHTLPAAAALGIDDAGLAGLRARSAALAASLLGAA